MVKVTQVFPDISCDCPYCGEWNSFESSEFEEGRYLETCAFAVVECNECESTFQIDILKP